MKRLVILLYGKWWKQVVWMVLSIGLLYLVGSDLTLSLYFGFFVVFIIFSSFTALFASIIYFVILKQPKNYIFSLILFIISWSIFIYSFIRIDKEDESKHRYHFKEMNDSISAIEADWQFKYKKFYKISDTNIVISISKIDSTIHSFTANSTKQNIYWNKEKITDLHFLKGEIYYKASDFDKSLKEFNASDQTDFKMGRVANYIKLKRFDEAFVILKLEEKEFYIYNLQLGNYYEVINNIDSAKSAYKKLYKIDSINKNSEDKSTTYTMFCGNCFDRIKELNKKHPILLKEFVLPTRRPK